MLLVTDRAGDLWVKTWNRSSLHTRPSWTVDTFQRQLKYHLFTHFIHTILVLPPSDYMYYYHYYLFGTKTAKACKNVYWLLLQSTAANISASQLLLRQNSKQKVVDRQPTIVWLRWSKHWLCQMQTELTQAVRQVVDQVVRQVEVSETVQLSYSVWQSLNFVLWDVQLRQFLQSSNLLQLTTHKTCKQNQPVKQTNKQTQSNRPNNSLPLLAKSAQQTMLSSISINAKKLAEKRIHWANNLWNNFWILPVRSVRKSFSVYGVKNIMS